MRTDRTTIGLGFWRVCFAADDPEGAVRAIAAASCGGLEGLQLLHADLAEAGPGVRTLRDRERTLGTLVCANAAPGLLDAAAEALARFLSLHTTIESLRTHRLAAEAERAAALRRLGREGLTPRLIGQDRGLRGVMERVSMVACAELPVLILGETGSGKEVIARSIHDASARSAGPFIRVNCGAIPAELIDSQLFGHERGSFTGATETRRGWFERAEGGTLLLDEVGELTPAAQVRLLRVLQDGSFERVGGQAHLRCDCRVIAATHRDLPGLVQEGRFRQDLWYRLAVFPIVIPPLRERAEDMRELAEHFTERACVRFGMPPLRLTERDLDLLCAYRWPGNIRELAAVIDRAVLLGKGGGIEVARALGMTSGHLPSEPEPRTHRDGFETLNHAMRRHIESALTVTGGRIEGDRGAAELLGINPQTLRARMRKLGIDWTRFRPDPR
ncbi:MAG: sigma-54-dependent Fis family transcriptional regulator [Phycisphaerales bacterium]|nr:sigma-54-dependent Fis family transcriptional regulator [Phycisphaerales bacterium]